LRGALRQERDGGLGKRTGSVKRDAKKTSVGEKRPRKRIEGGGKSYQEKGENKRVTLE